MCLSMWGDGYSPANSLWKVLNKCEQKSNVCVLLHAYPLYHFSRLSWDFHLHFWTSPWIFLSLPHTTRNKTFIIEWLCLTSVLPSFVFSVWLCFQDMLLRKSRNGLKKSSTSLSIFGAKSKNVLIKLSIGKNHPKKSWAHKNHLEEQCLFR